MTAMVAVAVVSALFSMYDVAHANHDITATDILSITYIQHNTEGDSTLVVTPDGSVILVDSPDTSKTHRETHKTLDEHGITTIDLMIATHKDADHIKGLNYILTNDTFTVSEIWFSQPNANGTNQVRDFYHNSGDRLTHPGAGHTKTFGNVTLEVLSPQNRTFANSNDNSIVTLLTYGDMEILFTGDVQQPAEQWLIDNVSPDKLDVDIMNSPHHGAETSSTQSFIDITTPELVIHSANSRSNYDGKDRHGNPDDTVIARYNASNVKQAHTGTDGDVNIQTDGTKCSLFFKNGPEMTCFDGILMLSDVTTGGDNNNNNNDGQTQTGGNDNNNNDGQTQTGDDDSVPLVPLLPPNPVPERICR